jgi:hypothetical protein
MPGVGPITGEGFDVWTTGTVALTGKDWDSPLKLVLGEGLAWIEEPSWAVMVEFPRSSRVGFVEAALEAGKMQSRQLTEFIATWKRRESQGGFAYPTRCGLDFPAKVNSDGSISGSDINDMELYFTNCWQQLSNTYLPQLVALGNSTAVRQSTPVRTAFSAAIQAIQTMANTYRSEGRFLGSNNDFQKAWTYLESDASEVSRTLTGIVSAIGKRNAQDSDQMMRFDKEVTKHVIE